MPYTKLHQDVKFYFTADLTEGNQLDSHSDIARKDSDLEVYPCLTAASIISCQVEDAKGGSKWRKIINDVVACHWPIHKDKKMGKSVLRSKCIGLIFSYKTMKLNC